jgi:hypothetical protein
MNATGLSRGGGAAAAAPSATIVVKSFAEGPVDQDMSYVVYTRRVFSAQAYEQVDRNLMQLIVGFIYFADLYGPDPSGTRNVLNGAEFRWSVDGDQTTILNTLQRRDIGHFFFTGHGYGDGFGNGSDTTFQTQITAGNIKTALENTFDVVKGDYAFKHPKRYVEIDGCNTGTGDLPPSFGIPKFRIDGKPNIKKRAYVGWNNLFYYGWQQTEYQQHVQTQNALWHSVDGDPVTIRDAIRIAIIEHNYQIDVNKTALHGSRLLLWPVSAQ